MAKKKTTSARTSVKKKPIKMTKVQAEKKSNSRKKSLKKTKYVTGKNNMLDAVSKASFRSKSSINEAVKNCDYNAVELAPAVKMMFKESENKAIKLSESYAKNIGDQKHQREFFQGVAQMEKKERRAVIKGYRRADQSRGVVHAMSQLPRQQCRTLMRDFVLDESGKKDNEGLKDVMFWLRDAGAQIRNIEGGNPVFPDGDTDEAVIEFFEDVADAIVDAVTTIVDELTDLFEDLVEAFVDVVNWVVDEITSLARALFEAGKHIWEVLKAAAEYGYQTVKKFVEAIQQVGKSLFEIMEDVFEFAADIIRDVIQAIDQLGEVLADLLSWLATKTFEFVKKGVEALLEIGKTIGNILWQALEFGATIIRNTVRALIEIGETIGSIMVTLVTRPRALLDEVVRAFNELGNSLADIINETAAAASDFVNEVARAAANIGTTLVEFADFIIDTAQDLATKVVDGILSAGRTLVDLISTVASRAVEAVRKVVEAAFELGRTVVGFLKEVYDLTVDLLETTLEAMFEIGRTIVEFTESMVKFTYRAAARLIEAAMSVGQSIADMLEAVVGATYFVFRKIVNGILQALGPVGDIFEWLIDRGEALASELWRQTVLAIRFVKESVTEVLDWALEQTDAIFDRILEIIEDIGSRISEVIDWAISAGETALELLGEATERVGNSISYVLNYLENDFIPGIAKFVEGVLNAAGEVADLVAWMARKSVEIIGQVLAGAIAAGIALSILLTEVMANPNQAIENFLQAVREIGQSLEEVYQAVVDAGEEFLDEVTQTLIEIGEDVMDMLDAAWEVSTGIIGATISILFEMLGSYRSLTTQEIADGQFVFGDSVDWDTIAIAQEGPFNDIVFGIQNWGNENPSSRAFVTGNLINFDVDAAFDRATLIHEITHVWQNQNIGPVYLAHAIAAQTVGDGYNYGYSEAENFIDIPNGFYVPTEQTLRFSDGTSRTETSINLLSAHEGSFTGLGGEDDLNNASTMSDFNEEQQGQILQQYFVRARLLGQTGTDIEPFQKYIDEVQAA